LSTEACKEVYYYAISICLTNPAEKRTRVEVCTWLIAA